MEAFVIDHNVPIPPARKGPEVKFPFALLGIGDSFFVPGERNNVSNAAHQYAKRHGVKFTVRKQGDGIRVWRVA
jgi:hypothetical protein